jgi:Protein of unknown function (DUF4058)
VGNGLDLIPELVLGHQSWIKRAASGRNAPRWQYEGARGYTDGAEDRAMPLRDHFRPPLDDITSWDGFHGAWPTVIVMAVNRLLPPRYVAAPRVHLGAFAEIDMSAYDEDEPTSFATPTGAGGGGVATAAWAPPRPTFGVVTVLQDQDEYEVRIYDTQRHRRLVAAVEIVSPANKDRPENRRAFVTKSAALLQQRVSVAMVDLVTTRPFNLYGDLLELIGQADPALAPEPPALYAAACRWTRQDDAWHFEAWAHALALGQPLPTLPLWLADDLAVPLELEASYEDTCRILRLP